MIWQSPNSIVWRTARVGQSAAVYAPKREALGTVFFTGAAAAAGLPGDPGDKEDNLYLFADAAVILSVTASF